MKLLFLIDNLKGGGAEKAIKIISEELYKRGFDVSLVLLENKKDYDIKNLNIYSLSDNITKFNFIFLLNKFNRLLSMLKPDIVYATNSKSHIITLLSNAPKKLINIQIDLVYQYKNREYILYFLLWLYKKADIFTFISSGIYKNLKNKLPDKKYIFLPNPIDLEEINKLKLESIKEYKDIFQKKVIINIGRLTIQKGQELLLKAFAKLNDDYNLVIIGVGELEEELKILSKKLNIDKRVYFLGYQANPFKFLYNSDIFVLSSLWEGFGNVIVEAMACGLGIVSTDCPSGPREIIQNNGILTKIDSNELYQGIIKMEKKLNYYKQLSLKRAKDFDKKIIINKLIKELNET